MAYLSLGDQNTHTHTIHIEKQCETHPALVTDRMADALPRDGKSSSAGVSHQRFSRDPRPQTFYTDERYFGDGRRQICCSSPAGRFARIGEVSDGPWLVRGCARLYVYSSYG